MLKDKDRIFQNLYNDKGVDVESSKKRGDWVNTIDLIKKGRDWIINEIKSLVFVQSPLFLEDSTSEPLSLYKF